MKIRIGKVQLNDTDKEKIRLGIKKMEEYEQEWLSKTLYENIREIELTSDEWKKVVENMPYKKPDCNSVEISGDSFQYPFNHTNIIRRDEKVIIQGNFVNRVPAQLIIDLIVSRTYELYHEPEKQPPQPETKTEPKPTLEQIRENKIRDIEKQIAEEVKAIELAKTLNLPEQITAHEGELNYIRKTLAVVQAGYEFAAWDGNKYESVGLEKYTGMVPLFALEELQKATGLFDDFRIWEERDDCDPILVGRIICGEHKTPYVIMEWS